MRRGRWRGRRKAFPGRHGASLPSPHQEIPEPVVPAPGVGRMPDPPDAQPRQVLDFERTPPPGPTAFPGLPEPEEEVVFERTPFPGPTAFPGEPNAEQWAPLGEVPDPAVETHWEGSPPPDLPINPRDNPAVLVPDATWKRARSFGYDASAFPVGRVVPFLNIKEGPGWLDIRSPDIAGVRWRLVGTEDLVGQLLTVTTGPSGWVSVWVGKMGTVVSAEFAAGGHVFLPAGGVHVDQADGRIMGGTPDPRFEVRFHEAHGTTSGGGSIQSRSLNSMPLPVVALAAGSTQNLGYPPLGREIFISHSLLTLEYSIAVGNPAIPTVVFTSAPVTAITLDVPADAFVRVTHPAGGAIRTFKAHWRDLAAVPQ